MENTLENKAKLFALYWGQNVRKFKNNQVSALLWPVNSNALGHIDQYYLELKHLSAISDEDALEVAKILSPHSFETYPSGWKINRHREDIEIVHGYSTNEFDIDFQGTLGVFDLDGEWLYLGNAEYLQAYDYLRSKGYALPFMGLSVASQISYGWVKLAEVC